MTPKGEDSVVWAILQAMSKNQTFMELGVCVRVDVARRAAAAALSAIAEPSEAMIRAGVSIWGDPNVVRIWRAMHAAMISEKDTGE